MMSVKRKRKRVVSRRDWIQRDRRADRKWSAREERLVLGALSSKVGQKFFQTSVRVLADVLGVKCAFICETVGDEAKRFRANAVWMGDELLGPIEYAAEGTPCKYVMGKRDFVVFPSNLKTLFPEDQMLLDFGLDSYAALPIWSRDGRHLGHIGIMDSEPLPKGKIRSSFFEVFAARARGELLRLRTEKSLLESESKFRSLVESSQDGIITLDSLGKIQSWNQAAKRLFQYSASEVIGKPAKVLLSANTQSLFHKNTLLFEKRPLGQTTEVLAKRKDGSVFPIEVSISSWRRGKDLLFSAIVRDISVRKQVEEDLRSMPSKLIAVQEAERRRIALEFHDELGQLLAALKMDVSSLGKQFSRKDIVRKRFDSCCDLVDRTIQTVRRVSSELRPVVLDEMGLVEAAKWQTQQFQQHSNIRCRFDTNLDLASTNTVSKEVSTALFRILQESLTNVSKHSKASQVRVSLEGTPDRLKLKIRDNGCGIIRRKSKEKCLGVLGMRERSRAHNGSFEVRRARGGGTIVEVELPLRCPA